MRSDTEPEVSKDMKKPSVGIFKFLNIMSFLNKKTENFLKTQTRQQKNGEVSDRRIKL